MKRKRGFTLIETLTVLVVLSMIAMITTPVVLSVINSSKEGLYDRQVDNIIAAGKSWGQKNMKEMPQKENESVYIAVKDLAKSGFIDSEEILDPRNNKEMNGCLVITLRDKKYNYKYENTSCSDIKGKYLITYDDRLELNQEIEVGSTYVEQNVTAVDSTGKPATVTGPTIKNTTTGKTVTSVDTKDVGTKYDLVYVAKDSNGNKKDLTIKVTIVDTTPPVITVQGKSDNFTYYYAIRDTKFVVPEASVTDNSGKVKPYNDKDYKVTSNVSNLPGTYRITYEAEDMSGNKRKLIVTVVIENTTLPVIKEVTGNPTSWQNKDATLVISGVSSKTKIVGYSFDDGVTWQTSNKKTFEENQTVKMKVKDQDGNISRTYEVAITKIDKTPPTKPVIELHKTNNGGPVIASGTWVNTDVSQVQKSTDNLSGIKGYERSLDKKTWKSMTENAIETKEQEQHYYVRAKDKAGNISEVSEVYIVRIDKVAPTCVSSGGSSAWRNTNLTLTGTCSDASGSVNSGCRVPTITGNFTDGINTTTATPGTVYDNAGNATVCPANQTVRIDKTAPSCNITFTGTTGNNGWFKAKDVTVALNKTDNGTVQSGIKSFGLKNTSGEAYNGSASNTQGDTKGTTWYGYVQDEAGNKNSCSNSVKVDKTPPTCTNIMKKDNDKGATYTSGSWHTNYVYTSASCGDTTSGCSTTKTLTTTGATTNVTDKAGGSWTVQANGTSYLVWKTYDNAGNSKACSQITAKVDRVNPKITWSVSYGAKHTDYNGNTCYSSVTLKATCSDATSGVSTVTIKDNNGDTGSGSGASRSVTMSGVGTSRYATATCKDKAGRSATENLKSSSYRVCKSSASSVCGCKTYKRSYTKCNGCEKWTSQGSELEYENPAGGCIQTDLGQEYGSWAYNSWEGVGYRSRTHSYYKYGCTLPTTGGGNYGQTGYYLVRYRDYEKCTTAKACAAAGCAEYSSCYHY